ncbi:MAG: ribosomal-processing cysteine protease Prp [Clostridiales bacterium]|nr:ribosomal-processing cysteine protease Prp [Clostridiales bacterium]
MTTVEFYAANGLLTGFKASGHAGRAQSGQNIVCAFISSACEMAANTISEIIALPCETNVSPGLLEIKINGSAGAAQDVLNGLKLHLTELQKDYEKEINVICTEV